MSELVDLLQAEPSTHQSVGVYTHSNGDYYLILIQSGVIYALALELSVNGQTLLAKYKEEYSTQSNRSTTVGGSNNQCKFETYVLGQVTGLGDRVEIGTYSVSGSALHYGWVFNWGGAEAVIVTQEITLDGSAVDYWTSRTYLLSVSEDQQGGLTASVSLSTSGQWQPKIGRPHIWIPIFSKGGMRLWYPVACNGAVVADYGDTDWQVPVHSFYKADGSRKIIYHENEVLPEYDFEDLVDEARTQLCGCLGWQTSYGVKEEEYIERLSGYYHGFTSNDGEDWRGYECPGGYYKWKKMLVEGPTYYESNSLPSINSYHVTQWTGTLQNYVLWEGRDGFNRSRYEVRGGHVKYEEESTSGSGDYYSEIAINALLFPFHSPESVFIARYRTQYFRLSGWGLGRNSITETRQWHINEAMGTLGGWETVMFPSTGTDCSLPAACDDNSLLTPCTYSWYALIPGESYSTSGIIEVKTTVGLTLVTPFDSIELDALEEVSDGSTPMELGSFYQVFFPAACVGDPTISKYNNLQSSFGNAIHTESGFDMSLGSNNAVDPPTTLQDSLWIGRS